MIRLIYFVIFIAVTGAVQAQQGLAKTYLEISPNDEADLTLLFDTLEQSLIDNLTIDDPVVVVLHGKEAFAFTRARYSEKKTLIDRAAMLDGYELLQVKMCATWMQANDIQRTDIPPFVEIIPYAPEEVKLLEDEGYVPFDRVEL